MKITEHFTWDEFAGTTGISYENLTAVQKRMVAQMAKTLETIRAAARAVKQGAVITLRSGIRNQAKYDALLAEGSSNPSETSDHFFGYSIISKNYPSGYNLGTGAADIVCPQMDTIDFFNLILGLRYSGKITSGQILIEKANTYWVHLANDPALFLSQEQLSKRNQWSKYGIGVSLSNGAAGSWTAINYGNYYNLTTAAKEAINNALSAVSPALADNKKKILIGTAIIALIIAGGIYSHRKSSKKRAEQTA